MINQIILNQNITPQEIEAFRKKEDYYDTTLNKYPSMRDYSLLKNSEYLAYMENVNPYEVKSLSNGQSFKNVIFDERVTEWELSEWYKCRSNFWYFVENYCKLRTNDNDTVLAKPFDFQKNIINSIIQNSHNIIMLGRQQGKTSTNCLYIVWYILFYEKRRVFLFGNNIDTAKENISKIYDIIAEIPFFLQSGFIKKNEKSFELVNGSKVQLRAPTSKSARGFTPHLVLWDEAAHTPDDEEFYTALNQTISSGAGKVAKMIVVSTPNGLGNTFSRLWHGAVDGTNGYKHVFAKWDDNPLKTEEWFLKQKRTMTEVKFKQEVLCTFLGSSNTLIDGHYLEEMRQDIQKPLHVRDNFTVYEEPVIKKQYVVACDVAEGLGMDYSVANIFDISQRPFKQVAVFRSNNITPIPFSTYVHNFAKKYNNAYIICESNSSPGGLVCNNIYHDLAYEHFYCDSYDYKRLKIGFNTNVGTKALGCTILKELLETRSLLVQDEETLNELFRFELHVPKSGTNTQKKTFRGASGSHDDLVMTLVIFAFLTDTHEFINLNDANLKYNIAQRRLEVRKEEELPLPMKNDFYKADSSENFDFYDLLHKMTNVYDPEEEFKKKYTNFIDETKFF